MKICVLGLDAATPEIFFQDERLVNIRRLMELGVYGTLQGVLPPGPLPGWISLAASQDPGSLGLYGRRNPSSSYGPQNAVPALPGPAIWDQVAGAGRQSILIAVPPDSPPRHVAGIVVASAAAVAGGFASPAGIQDQIHQLVGEYPAAAQFSSHQSHDALRGHIFDLSRKQWEVARWLMREKEWDYFHFVDIGLARLQPAFWEFYDPAHARYQPGSPWRHVIADYYLWLDEQIGGVLELLDAETAILLASTGGMQRLDGAFAINQWFFQEGLLALQQPPGPGIASFNQLSVDWANTKVWAGEGPLAPIYFNVKGREPQGILPADCESFADELAAKLQSFAAARPLALRVLKPTRIYRQVRGAAPDLMLQLAGGRWSADAALGHPDLYISQVADGSAPAPSGVFVLTAPNCPLAGEYTGATLLDMAPTLLDLAGYEIPAEMQGRSLLAGMEKKSGGTPSADQIILDRLAGLGYV